MSEPLSVIRNQLPQSLPESVEKASSLHSEGRLREAEQLYQLVLEADPAHFDALFRLGAIRLRQGRFADARQLLLQAIEMRGDFAEVHGLLGSAMTGLRLNEQAISHYEKAIAIKPDYAEAHNNLGYTLHVLGRAKDSIAHFQQALAIKPAYPEAHNNFGNALLALGQFEEAIRQFEAALNLRANYAEAYHNLGNGLLALGRRDEALNQYRKATAIKSDYADAYYGHGKTLDALDRTDEAIGQYEKALSINPNHIDARIALGNAFHQVAQFEAALAHYDKALAINPLGARISLADAHQRRGHVEKALTQYGKAQAIDPGHVGAHLGRGDAFLALGKIAEARRAYEAAIALAPSGPAGYLKLGHIKRYTEADPHFVALTHLGPQIPSFPIQAQKLLHFALGKALADVGDHEKAFHHFLEGNALKRQQVNYDEAHSLGMLERIREVFSRELIQQKSIHGEPCPVPIFIIGMPRSGTTLVEQILSSHPSVFGAGELQHLRKLANGSAGPQLKFPESVRSMSAEEVRELGRSYLSSIRDLAPRAARITDKMPANFMLAGFVQVILPNARIVHVRRDPCDTALSCFSLTFEGHIDYCYDLAELGRYYRAYNLLMTHWRGVLPPEVMLEVQYEELVGNLEQEARRIVTHCGLDWDDACLEFHATERPVLTASAVQVRQPIYNSSIGRSKPYESFLRPFVEAFQGSTNLVRTLE
ncbi:MAG: tetratricopeptide repeat protein [Alphaproteobacteria bacterium]|nr:tetratricopeptide repeat protein [Alphaproteobacteria bacterium]